MRDPAVRSSSRTSLAILLNVLKIYDVFKYLYICALARFRVDGISIKTMSTFPQ